jgi:hypothetical protein
MFAQMVPHRRIGGGGGARGAHSLPQKFYGRAKLIRIPFQKMLPPHGKILKKGPDKISNKVVYVYCVSKAVGQTNTVPPQQD